VAKRPNHRDDSAKAGAAARKAFEKTRMAADVRELYDLRARQRDAQRDKRRKAVQNQRNARADRLGGRKVSDEEIEAAISGLPTVQRHNFVSMVRRKLANSQRFISSQALRKRLRKLGYPKEEQPNRR
jgi:hypothetical protein